MANGLSICFVKETSLGERFEGRSIRLIYGIPIHGNIKETDHIAKEIWETNHGLKRKTEVMVEAAGS